MFVQVASASDSHHLYDCARSYQTKGTYEILSVLLPLKRNILVPLGEVKIGGD